MNQHKMSVFHITAEDRHGKKIYLSLAAESEDNARQTVRERGYRLVQMSPAPMHLTHPTRKDVFGKVAHQVNIDWSWTCHDEPAVGYVQTMEAIVKILEGEDKPTPLESLLRNLRNLDAANEFGYTLLHYATQIESLVPGGIPWTLSFGEKVDLLRRERYLPPDRASTTTEKEHGVIREGTLVKILLEAGVNVNCHTQGGYTPLHYAARYDNAEIAQLLLDHGADPTRPILQDRFQGCRPIDLAHLYKATRVFNLLHAVSSQHTTVGAVRLLRDAIRAVGEYGKRKWWHRCLQCHEPLLYTVCYASEGGYDGESWTHLLCENCGASLTHDSCKGLRFYLLGDPRNSRSIFLDQVHRVRDLLNTQASTSTTSRLYTRFFGA